MVDVADAGLEALDDNGGETETHALASDSPALDFIETDSQSEDQRGFDRPVDANNDLLEYYDAGAFESGAFEIVTEDTPCDTADCVPTLLRYACKDPSADPFLSTLFLVSTDVRYQFYSHLPLLCKFANFVFKIEPLVSDEPLDIPEIPTENLDEAFNALVTSAACPIFSEFITPHMFYNKTQRRELLLWQTFLKNRFNADVNLNGLYDSKTESAIKKFQTQFSDVVLDPWTWGPSKLDSQPTGRIYKLTQALANIFVGCGSAPQWIEDAQQSFDILAAVKSKYAEFIQAPTTSGIVVSSPVPMPKRLPRLRR
jgi:hypothetical protein